ncbi:helix-turn-helix domain-containing protein [Providencia alcalifaciens]|uniref:helix-turn-helix domain-containing protein n=1 Tax=Providencia alcalifaciens TaxID=126385 RepID=UPI001CC407B8|nr:helix-turn-helix transcriptional regulator [Providencia alcalifaciens]
MLWLKILPNFTLLFFTPILFKNKNRFVLTHLFYLICFEIDSYLRFMMSLKKIERITKSFSQAIADEIASLRRKRLLSGRQLGSLIGVSQQQISRYENGVCEITLSTLCLLLHYLGVSLESFFFFVSERIEAKEPELYGEFSLLFEQHGALISK